jgi:hypothetical protein
VSSCSVASDRPRRSVFHVLRELAQHPFEIVVRRWNWKSAVMSSILRALIFFCANLTAGLHAAFAALFTELTFRGVVSGFYGALTEAFRFAEPEWAAALVVMILLPLAGHSAEFAVHFLRGTAKLRAGMMASVCFTAISTVFNLYVMRRGALITGSGQQSLGSDMKRMPRLIAGFLACAPLAVVRCSQRKWAAARPCPTASPAGELSSD